MAGIELIRSDHRRIQHARLALRELAGERIREAVWEAALQTLCSPGWWRTVLAGLPGFAEHCDQHERGIIAGFQLRASAPLREELAAQWLAFTSARRQG